LFSRSSGSLGKKSIPVNASILSIEVTNSYKAFVESCWLGIKKAIASGSSRESSYMIL
jgi:hypothetical protein